MSKQCARSRHALLEKRTNTSPSRDRQNPNNNNNNSFNFLKKIYPIGLHKTCSPLSLSSLSLSLSQTSNDSSITDSSVTPLDQKIAFALRLIAPPERREALANRNAARQQPSPSPTPSPASSVPSDDNEEVKRCNWITKNSGECLCKLVTFLSNNAWIFTSLKFRFLFPASLCLTIPIIATLLLQQHISDNMSYSKSIR